MTTDPYAELTQRADETVRRLMPGPYQQRPQRSSGPLSWARAVAFGDLWNRPHLNDRDRRLITIAILGLIGSEETISIHVGAALRHGDLGTADLNELVAHFGGYAGFPRASALNAAVQREIEAFRAEGGATETGSPDQIVREFLAGFGRSAQSDLDNYAAGLTEDVYFDTGSRVLEGREAVLDYMRDIPSTFGVSHFAVKIVELASRGNVVLTERVDDIFGPDGSLIYSAAVSGTFEVRDGKIAVWRDFWDTGRAAPAFTAARERVG
jgi:limonene-1,2-epoxide hydrolase/alkylhydroperoxidase/carboxymuconolactone decarboxylase family protein YurZ